VSYLCGSCCNNVSCIKHLIIAVHRLSDFDKLSAFEHVCFSCTGIVDRRDLLTVLDSRRCMALSLFE